MIRQVLGTFIFVCFSILYTGAQSGDSHFNTSYFEQQRFAHRGGYATGPENTLKTILNNINNGVNAIEVDVQLTKDSQLVLFHDHGIGRLLQFDLDLSIGQLSLAELKEIPLRNALQGLQYICSLDELVDTLSVLIPLDSIEDFTLEIDFKPHGNKTKAAVDALMKVLDTHVPVFENDIYNHFFISTFYPEVLKEIHRQNPRIVLAFAVNNSPDDDKFKAKLLIARAHRFINKYEVRIIEPNMCMVNQRFVRKWHRRGILINAYTANTSCEKNYLENLGIAFTTNCPGENCYKDDSSLIEKRRKWCRKCN